ncbi:MAG TPA: helix-turn-helix domain-containing protein [Pirellulales bacterium]|jgi:AcrR family transcriptional regulator|nr:helix-turn-helix domain-containing protein [Pirellulales bacterium]
MSSSIKRKYQSRLRSQAAEATRQRVLRAAKAHFTRHGIDRVTIAEIAERAEVAASTVYALFKSKEGILRELMSRAIFGERFRSATEQLKGVHDPVKLIGLTAQVARAIYEGESTELGLLRGASAFSPALRKLEQEFERLRFEMQEERVRLLFEQAKQKQGLPFDEARRLLWMYTSREVYRMLVQEGGWTPDRYQRWLADTLVATLVDADHQGERPGRRR